MTLYEIKTAPLYPDIKACLAEWSAGAVEMTDQAIADALRKYPPNPDVPNSPPSPDAWLVVRAIGLGMRLVIGRDRHGDFCRLVEGIQLRRPTINIPGEVAKQVLGSGLLREMEEHDSQTHGGWRASGIKGAGCRVYALEM